MTLFQVSYLGLYVRNCIIVGSGRSGTSMLAGVLHTSGYNMGDQLLPPTSSNPRGYFESSEINELNNDLLSAVIPVRPRRPLSYLYPRRLSAGQLWLADIGINIELLPTPSQVHKMSALIPPDPFCLKDPRFCYTLAAWRDSLACDVFLCVFREPGRTAASIVKDCKEQRYRGLHVTRKRALHAWTSMYKHIVERHRYRGEWVFIHYEQILDGSAIPRIEDILDTEVDSSIVDPKLMRSPDSNDLPQQTVELYRHLCSLAAYSE